MPVCDRLADVLAASQLAADSMQACVQAASITPFETAVVDDHAWEKRDGRDVCRACGVVMRLDGGANRPCPGPVKVQTRHP